MAGIGTGFLPVYADGMKRIFLLCGVACTFLLPLSAQAYSVDYF